MAVTLSNAETTATLSSSLITTIAVLVGGFWAYFKLVKGRTFSARANIETSGTWCMTQNRHLLKFKVTLTNVGSSRFRYISNDTFLQVRKLTPRQEKAIAGPVFWERAGIRHRLFSETVDGTKLYEWWLDPGESTTDEFLIDLQTPEPLAIRYDIRITYRRHMSSEMVQENGIVLPD